MMHVDALSRVVYTITSLTLEDELLYKQLSDPIVQRIAESVEMEGRKHFTLVEGLVFRVQDDRLLLLVPEQMEGNIIRIYHDEMGHVGIEKTVKGIQSHYWFPSMKKKCLVILITV